MFNIKHNLIIQASPKHEDKFRKVYWIFITEKFTDTNQKCSFSNFLTLSQQPTEPKKIENIPINQLEIRILRDSKNIHTFRFTNTNVHTHIDYLKIDTLTDLFLWRDTDKRRRTRRNLERESQWQRRSRACGLWAAGCGAACAVAHESRSTRDPTPRCRGGGRPCRSPIACTEPFVDGSGHSSKERKWKHI